jgi:hypothetical protein
MSQKWRMIRVPVELASRLDRLVAQFEESHVAGRLSLPNEFCEHCPLHHVISVALDSLEDHRARSKRPRRPRRSSDAASLDSPQPRKGMYT